MENSTMLFRLKTLLNKRKKERREIYESGYEQGKNDFGNDILDFIDWFDHERNSDLHEIKWFIEARIKKEKKFAEPWITGSMKKMDDIDFATKDI
jgi:hypothetical protein